MSQYNGPVISQEELDELISKEQVSKDAKLCKSCNASGVMGNVKESFYECEVCHGSGIDGK